jgi:hypothetical protein
VSEFNGPGHHRHGSVQNAITYLCISPDLHSCSKGALYGSEGLVLPRSNRNGYALCQGSSVRRLVGTASSQPNSKKKSRFDDIPREELRTTLPSVVTKRNSLIQTCNRPVGTGSLLSICVRITLRAGLPFPDFLRLNMERFSGRDDGGIRSRNRCVCRHRLNAAALA